MAAFVDTNLALCPRPCGAREAGAGDRAFRRAAAPKCHPLRETLRETRIFGHAGSLARRSDLPWSSHQAPEPSSIRPWPPNAR